jgi:outer membrane scaffolding protein for murein synthesis (MipA/OmpV family)
VIHVQHTARAALGLLAATSCSLALAQEGSALPLWELGAVGLASSQQAYPGAAEQVSRGLALPYLIYRGKFLRADRGGAGLRALKTEDLELDLGFAGSFGSRSSEVLARQGMPDLGTLVQFGPRLKWTLGQGPGKGRWRLELPLRGVFDLDSGLAYQGAAFEPELVFERQAEGGWSYSTSLSAIWGNQRLADTFYGVAPAYATALRPAYQASSGHIAWRLSASVSRKLTPQWRLFSFARADSVAGAANAESPLVQQKTGTTVGLVLAYTWQQSTERGLD